MGDVQWFVIRPPRDLETEVIYVVTVEQVLADEKTPRSRWRRGLAWLRSVLDRLQGPPATRLVLRTQVEWAGVVVFDGRYVIAAGEPVRRRISEQVCPCQRNRPVKFSRN